MSERMTDKRLAEIEAWLADHPFTIAFVEELLQALKAERAEVARLRGFEEQAMGFYAECEITAAKNLASAQALELIWKPRAEAAEAKLEKVGELVASNRWCGLVQTGELEALLKKNAPGPAGGE